MEPWEQRLDDPEAAVYPIGVVSELLGTDVATIRRYDDAGIVSPGRSDAGQRRYSRSHIAQLARALSLSAEGIGPPGIRRILDLEIRIEELERADPAEE
jgi:MerR family transcriptional regulator, heat shock protein HspR